MNRKGDCLARWAVTQPEQSDVKGGYDKSERVRYGTSGEVVSYILSEGGWWAKKGGKGLSRKGQVMELDLEGECLEYLQDRVKAFLAVKQLWFEAAWGAG